MATVPAAQITRRANRSGAVGRVVALVIGVIVLLCGLGFVVAGGALLWADRDGNRVDGFLFSDEEPFSSTGFAITSDRIELSTGAEWLPIEQTFGKARLQVTTTGSTDVFLGIAPVADASGYLDGVSRSVVDLGAPANAAETVAGDAPAGPPGEQSFWTDSVSGPGTQRLTWTPEQGNWMLVVMNADGSAGVAVQAQVGATLPSLTGWAWGLLIGGAVAFLIAVLLLSLSSRTGPERRVAVPRPAPPAGTPYVPAPRSGPETRADRPRRGP